MRLAQQLLVKAITEAQAALVVAAAAVLALLVLMVLQLLAVPVETAQLHLLLDHP
jgi:hypothetical protein